MPVRAMEHRLCRRFVLPFLLLVCLPSPRSARAGWEVFSPGAEGVGPPGIVTNGIAQDHQGSYWVSTTNGVGRYDGLTWTPFGPDSGLAWTLAGPLLVDASGALWCGVWGGVSRLQPASTRFETFRTGVPRVCLPTDNITAIAQDHRGVMWFGTGIFYNSPSGVASYDGSSWTCYTYQNSGLVGDDIRAIAEDAQHNIWVATNAALCRLDSTRTSWQDMTGYLPPGWKPLSLFQDASGTFWIGTDRGIVYVDASGWHVIGPETGIPARPVLAVRADHAAILWGGPVGGGLGKRQGEQWEWFTTADGLPSNVVKTIYEDPGGRIWLACGSGDVVLHDRSYWKQMRDSLAVFTNGVETVLRARDGALWFGTPGLARFAGGSWTYLGAAHGGPVQGDIRDLFEDSRGDLWAGTNGLGIYRFRGDASTVRDPAQWTRWDVTSGLPSNSVNAIAEDATGNVLVGTPKGIGVFTSAATWDTLYVLNDASSIENQVEEIIPDDAGDLWVGTSVGKVWELQSGEWSLRSPPPYNKVNAMAKDHLGRIWFGKWWEGFYVIDPAPPYHLIAYGTTVPAGSDFPSCLMEDSRGHMWLGGLNAGIRRFDGELWTPFRASDGLVGSTGNRIAEDTLGRILTATDRGISILEPDTIPPKTTIVSRPSQLVATGDVQVSYVAAFGETRGVEFSTSLDGQPWSSWSATKSWSGSVPDGSHELRVRARDRLNNQEHVPAGVTFIVDTQSPSASILTPTHGEPVKGRIEVHGTASAARLVYRTLRARHSEQNPVWSDSDAALLNSATTNLSDGLLGFWETAGLTEGRYDLRLDVADSLGRLSTVTRRVVVDNEFPYVDETSPVSIQALEGGHVYTTGKEVALYCPPRAFASDANVTVVVDLIGGAADSLGTGQRRTSAAFDIGWGGALLNKALSLEVRLAEGKEEHLPVLCREGAGGRWDPKGGTFDRERRTVSAAVTEAGRYAVFNDVPGDRTGPFLDDIRVTPGILTPSGVLSSTDVAISFTLGRPGDVTVSVYNRAGRRVRRVVESVSMREGANLVRWDGRDDNAAMVRDGLYVVTVQALGEVRRRPLAVVR